MMESRYCVECGNEMKPGRFLKTAMRAFAYTGLASVLFANGVFTGMIANNYRDNGRHETRAVEQRVSAVESNVNEPSLEAMARYIGQIEKNNSTWKDSEGRNVLVRGGNDKYLLTLEIDGKLHLEQSREKAKTPDSSIAELGWASFRKDNGKGAWVRGDVKNFQKTYEDTIRDIYRAQKRQELALVREMGGKDVERQ